MKFIELKWICAALIIACYKTKLVASQADEPEENVNNDYSIPGEATPDCTCVPVYQCDKNEIITDGSFILDPRKRPTELPIGENYVPPRCGPFHVCCGKPPTPRTGEPYVHHCGARNPNGIAGRILTAQGTGEAEVGEWPYQAAILQRKENIVFKCGGTIIDEKHVLTVAHCVDKFLDNKDEIIVRLGLYDTQNEIEDYPYEDYGVDEIIIHPQYRSNNLYNDIAILVLDREIEYKPHIDSICLPKDDDDFTGHDCIVTGWGMNAYKSGAYSAILKEIAVPIIANDDCEQRLRKTRLGKYFKLYGGFICAGGKENEDSCKGDGGGPLFCYKNDGSYALAGIVSWGIECGRSNVPGVYVNVKKYLDWIVSKTNKPLQSYWE